MMYFPNVWAEVARVSKLGNDQHNPGEPLHWSRLKSDDHLDSAMRHMIDYGVGARLDTDGAHHLAKAIWRLCAELQIDLEKADLESATSQPFTVLTCIRDQRAREHEHTPDCFIEVGR